MKLDKLEIIIATFADDEMVEGAYKHIAQSNNYPVANGLGSSIDDAVIDLCFNIIHHLHQRRQGR